MTKLVGAKSLIELTGLQATHSWNQFYALFRQADELGALAVRVIADITEASLPYAEEESNGSG
jgi:hypothetical protein